MRSCTYQLFPRVFTFGLRSHHWRTLIRDGWRLLFQQQGPNTLIHGDIITQELTLAEIHIQYRGANQALVQAGTNNRFYNNY